MKGNSQKKGFVLMAILAVLLLTGPTIASAAPTIYHVTDRSLEQRPAAVGGDGILLKSTVLAHLPPVEGMEYPPRPFPRQPETNARSFGSFGERHGRNPDRSGARRRFAGQAAVTGQLSEACPYSSQVGERSVDDGRPEETPNMLWSSRVTQAVDYEQALLQAMDWLEPLNVDRLK